MTSSRIRRLISSFLQRQFFKDSFWMTFYSSLDSAFAVIYFILLARHLGTENYGIFVGVKAAWAIIFPFVGMGLYHLMIQNVSRDASKFARFWGDTLLVYFISLGIASLAILPIVQSILSDAPAVFIFLIFLGDFLGHGLCLLSCNAFVANHKIKEASQYSILLIVGKLISVLCLPLFTASNSLLAWGFLYFISSFIPALVLVGLVWKYFGPPNFRPRELAFSQIKEGFYFSLSASALRVNSEADRSMLMELGTPMAAGLYGAAYRFIDMGFMPIFSVLGASYTRFFKYGEEGVGGALGFARKLLPFAIIYGLFTWVALILFSPLVPRILGEGFTEATAVIVWLSPLHLIGGLQFLAADTLTGSGFQRSRSIIQVTAALFNVGLNFVLIPIFSWKGAIIATLSSETFKLATLWLVVLILYLKSARAEKNVDNSTYT